MARYISFTNNLMSGGLIVDLPKEFRINCLKPTNLQLQLLGEEHPRVVTYIMGSEARGFTVCCRGSGAIPREGKYRLIVE